MKKAFILIMIVNIFWAGMIDAGINNKGGNMSDKLSLKISINKDKYKLGEEFIVNYSLKNESDKDLKVLLWRFEYTTNNLTVYEKITGKEIKKQRLFIYELKFVPDKENFITLAPQQPYTKTFKGTVNKEDFSKLKRGFNNKKFGEKTTIIDFEDSAFLLNVSEKEYKLKAVYKSDQKAIEKGKKLYGIEDDVWNGTLQSNEVGFTVE